MDQGSIINVSSNHAFSTMPSHFPYNAIKTGINGMTRAMALDFGPGIRVNTFNPGWVEVKRTTAEMTDKERQELESIHPPAALVSQKTWQVLHYSSQAMMLHLLSAQASSLMAAGLQ